MFYLIFFKIHTAKNWTPYHWAYSSKVSAAEHVRIFKTEDEQAERFFEYKIIEVKVDK